MAEPNDSTTHRHQDSRKQWTTRNTPGATAPTRAEFTALEARVKALETVPPVPPATEPPPVVVPPAGKSVRVTSIAALKNALADDSLDEIVLANGTYAGPGNVSVSKNRTRTVVVRPDTPQGVTFDGNGATYWNALALHDGAAYMDWRDFRAVNGRPTSTGAIVVGGLSGQKPAHHVSVRRWKFDKTVTGDATQPHDHLIYVSACSPGLGGPHDLLFEDIEGDGAGGLTSMFNFGHDLVQGEGPADNAHDVVVRGMKAVNFSQTIVVWEGVLKNLLFENGTITASKRFACRYENYTDTGIVFRGIKSSGTVGGQGFYSSRAKPTDASPPPGVVFIGTDWR